MHIEERVRSLGEVDHASLKAKVLTLDEEVWHLDTLRDAQPQRKAVNSVVLVFCNGWQPIRVERRSGWDYLNEQVMPLANAIIEQHYQPGGQFLRIMVARLTVGGTIQPHIDQHPSFAVGHRIHVPLITNNAVEFVVDDQPVLMKEGQAYELNNLLPHSVFNGGKEDRMHLIFDYMDPQQAQ
ncbi:MAG: aspartyl/asparaginyl beta-hydroxylase domain-containing protein [Pseudomonadales bacterium]